DLLVPRRAISRSDVEKVEISVVGERIPGSAPASIRPPLPVPGLCGPFHRFGLEGLRWVARHCVKSPGLLPRLRVVGCNASPDPQLRASVSHYDLSLDHSGRAGNRIGLVLIDSVDLPDTLAGLGV